MAAARKAARPKKAATAAKRGAPTKYTKDMLRIAGKAAKLGATDREIAEMWGIAESTFYAWKHAYPELSEALKLGKEAADNRVEQSLYRKATGYTFESEKVFQYEGQIVRARTLTHVPPSDTAIIFWLKNRKPGEWRDKVEHALSGEIAINILPEDERL